MIDEIVSLYLTKYPQDKEKIAGLLTQLTANETMNDRKNFNGHVTGSALILSPDRTKLLVIHHKLFNKWLQPGGHWDLGEDGPWLAAAREAVEETGVSIDYQLPTNGGDIRIPIQIGTHMIKNRPQKKEPGHPHHDFMYLFVAKSEELKPRAKEVNITDIAWVNFTDEKLSDIKSSVDRLQAFLKSSQE